MDPDSLEKLDWIPEPDKARLRNLMAAWTGPGKGFVFIAVPPAPGREGYTVFQPCIDPDHNPRTDPLTVKTLRRLKDSPG